MKNKSEFQKDLISWFRKNQRELPWRKDKEPYKIWVSEIMLQQTKVDTVIPYFNRFMRIFPTIESLAKAKEEDVLKAWEGLGYYSRARNLQQGAKQVMQQYKGKIPENSDIEKIRGIGPYTKGAILSIAYGKAEPAVDGNVMRVYSRIFSVWDDIAKTQTRHIFEKLVRETIDQKNTSDFNQGIMELGALICTPTNPKCKECPVKTHCQAFQDNSQGELPIKSKKKPPKPIKIAVVLLFDEKGNIVTRKRSNPGLLENLWEFPNMETETKAILEEEMRKTFGKKVYVKEKLMELTHIFTHIKWEMTVYKGKIEEQVKENESLKLIPFEELTDLPFPVAYQKIYKEVKQNGLQG